MITASRKRKSIMTPTDISFDPARHAHREPDARQVLDLVLHQQLRTFSALEIAHVAEVLPSEWVSRNIGAITNARADDTRDWYFPVYTPDANSTRTRTSSSWSGVHHLAENQASATVHPLPPLPAVPPAWRISTIVASGGGLLLLMPSIYSTPSSENGAVVRACRACGSAGGRHVRDCWMNSNDWGHTRSRLMYEQPKVPQDWKPLLVCNPLTKSWRELPPPAAAIRGSMKWRYDEVLIDMIVDERANSYTIAMTFRKPFRMCVYTSISKTWVHHQYERLGSLGTVCANAVVRGRLCYAFVDFDAPNDLATLRVFEIEVRTGEWRRWNEYTLEVWVWDFFPRVMPLAQQREASVVLRYLGLVECMGDMYAVIPTREDEFIIINNNVAHAVAAVAAHAGREVGFVAMPVQFHILRFNRENNPDVNGVLRIRVPRDRRDIPFRRWSLMEKTSSEHSPFWNWFSCTAKGSVIWVTCEDYLLQYDVVSGQSKTQIIQKSRLTDAGVSYRPSFHMKPYNVHV